MGKMTFTSKKAKLVMDTILIALASAAMDRKSPNGRTIRGKGMTHQQIQERIGISMRWTGGYLTHMHDAGLIHIKNWPRRARGDNYRVPAFTAGPGIDAPKPKPPTAVEKVRAYRKRLYEDPARHESILARKRARQIPPHADPMISAFFGQPKIVVRMTWQK